MLPTAARAAVWDSNPHGPMYSRRHSPIVCSKWPRQDSNLHCAVSETAASASWATEPMQRQEWTRAAAAAFTAARDSNPRRTRMDSRPHSLRSRCRTKLGGRIRTPGLVHPRHALCQAERHPVDEPMASRAETTRSVRLSHRVRRLRRSGRDSNPHLEEVNLESRRHPSVHLWRFGRGGKVIAETLLRA